MARWHAQNAFAKRELDKILSDWSENIDDVRAMPYKEALQRFAPNNTKNRYLSAAIAAAAYSIFTRQWFDNSWHDKLTEILEEQGYEAGFYVRDILSEYLSDEQRTIIYKSKPQMPIKSTTAVNSRTAKSKLPFNLVGEHLYTTMPNTNEKVCIGYIDQTDTRGVYMISLDSKFGEYGEVWHGKKSACERLFEVYREYSNDTCPAQQ